MNTFFGVCVVTLDTWHLAILFDLVQGSSCGRNTDPADGACTAARVRDAACAASGLMGGTCAPGGVLATLTAAAAASQPLVPPAAYAGLCGGTCGHSGRCCGAVVGLLLRDGCTDSVEIGVAVCVATFGLCGLGVVLCVLGWEELVEELDTAVSAVSVCTLGATCCARSVGGRMVGMCVRSVRGLSLRFGRLGHLPSLSPVWLVWAVLAVWTEGHPSRC